MLLRIICLTAVLLIFGLSANAQDSYTSEYTISPKVAVDLPQHAEQEIIYMDYRIRPKNTIFGISKFFGISPFAIKQANPQIGHVRLQPGDLIRIPLPKKKISLSPSAVTLQYTVGRQDTWYGIAKRQLGYDPERLKRLNAEMGPVLHPGKEIIIGYLNLSASAPTSEPLASADTVMTSVTNEKFDTIFHAQHWTPAQHFMKLKFDQQSERITTQSTRGKAIWRGGSSDQAFYVLHPRAHIGSIVEIYNPMHRTKLYAKVIGRIPEKAYPSDVQLVVSAAVARQLGALDPQFFAKTTFIPVQSY